jgi:Uncharacterised protein family (UPF0158)
MITTSVSLDKLIDALEEGSESAFGFLDRESGEVYFVSDEALSLSESETDPPYALADWQKEELELAQRIQSSDRYLALPGPRDVNEWNIMAAFSEQIKRDDIRARFVDSIRGSGAFRRFKQQLAHFGRWDEWNSFRREAFGRFMREWCEENGIILASKDQLPAP